MFIQRLVTLLAVLWHYKHTVNVVFTVFLILICKCLITTFTTLATQRNHKGIFDLL